MNKKRGRVLGNDETDNESELNVIDLDSPEPEPAADDFHPNNEAVFPWAETTQTGAIVQMRISRNFGGRRTAS